VAVVVALNLQQEVPVVLVVVVVKALQLEEPPQLDREITVGAA
jgi:hypothetical protein